jgi:parvulin-like peptidyl-prolyl isomerase
MKTALLVIFAATTAASAAPPGATATIDRVAARVNGRPIWKSDVEERVEAAAKAGGPSTPEAYKQTLDAMIDQAVILSRADELHIATTNAEIDAAIDEIKQANQIDDTQLEAALAKGGMTRAQYRVELGIQIKIQRTMVAELGPQIHVSDDDIHKAYAQLKAAKPDTPPLDGKATEELKQRMFMKHFEELRDPWLAKRRALSHVEKLP